jgi:hypothetical protein
LGRAQGPSDTHLFMRIKDPKRRGFRLVAENVLPADTCSLLAALGLSSIEHRRPRAHAKGIRS